MLQGVHYVFCLSVDEPIPSFSNVLAEAMCCGATVVVNEGFDAAPYERVMGNIRKTLLEVPVGEPRAMAEAIVEHWKNYPSGVGGGVSPVQTFNEYVGENIRVLEKASR